MTNRQNDTEASDIAGLVDAPAYPSPLAYEAEPGFDEGLVHDHGWACRERGAPAC